MERETLREQLIEWTDWDGAAFCLAMLGELVAAGVLENRDEPDDQYRWNPAFVGSWEIPWKPAAIDGED